MTLLMLKGLPASGKSTYARDLAAGEGNWVRVNKDDLRTMTGRRWSRRNEKIILAARDAFIAASLDRGLNVVVDDTNLHPSHHEALQALAAQHGTTFEIKTFDTDVDTCIARDAQRERPVGAEVIRRMHRDFLATPPEHPTNPLLEPAVIVDLDGTLAIIEGRSPYDDTDVSKDRLNTAVHNVVTATVNSLGAALIIMSGRDHGRSRASTLQWLERHDICPRLVLMRPSGDSRKDAVVKRELFDNHIANKFRVAAVFDDRDQVVRMWRDDLDLPCFQVNWGAF